MRGYLDEDLWMLARRTAQLMTLLFLSFFFSTSPVVGCFVLFFFPSISVSLFPEGQWRRFLRQEFIFRWRCYGRTGKWPFHLVRRHCVIGRQGDTAFGSWATPVLHPAGGSLPPFPLVSSWVDSLCPPRPEGLVYRVNACFLRVGWGPSCACVSLRKTSVSCHSS